MIRRTRLGASNFAFNEIEIVDSLVMGLMDNESDVNPCVQLKLFEDGSETESNGSAATEGAFVRVPQKTVRWQVLPEASLTMTIAILIVLSLMIVNTYKLHVQSKKTSKDHNFVNCAQILIISSSYYVGEELNVLKERLRISEKRQMLPGPKGLKGEVGERGMEVNRDRKDLSGQNIEKKHFSLRVRKVRLVYLGCQGCVASEGSPVPPEHRE